MGLHPKLKQTLISERAAQVSEEPAKEATDEAQQQPVDSEQTQPIPSEEDIEISVFTPGQETEYEVLQQGTATASEPKPSSQSSSDSDTEVESLIDVKEVHGVAQLKRKRRLRRLEHPHRSAMLPSAARLLTTTRMGSDVVLTRGFNASTAKVSAALINLAHVNQTELSQRVVESIKRGDFKPVVQQVGAGTYLTAGIYYGALVTHKPVQSEKGLGVTGPMWSADDMQTIITQAKTWCDEDAAVVSQQFA